VLHPVSGSKFTAQLLQSLPLQLLRQAHLQPLATLPLTPTLFVVLQLSLTVHFFTQFG